ncbi:MAG: XisH family protein [Chloroflexi bacterium]|nr:XisH family protein [Chloroflexota bacterium]
MPAKDDHHDIVVRCLTNAGWTILSEQEYLSIGTSPETHRRLYIDIKAGLSDGLVILIEVKSLARSPVHQLMELLGQYLVYRAALEYLDIDIPLYIAVTQQGFENAFHHVLGQQIMRQYEVQLVVYDPLLEEIREWIPIL